MSVRLGIFTLQSVSGFISLHWNALRKTPFAILPTIKLSKNTRFYQ